MKVMFSVSVVLGMVLMVLINNMMEKSAKKQEKKAGFESGFNPMMMKKMAFSTNFLLLAMMFLIFDVEISILIPIILMNKHHQIMMTTITMTLITILVIMTMKEWKQGSLEWAN